MTKPITSILEKVLFFPEEKYIYDKRVVFKCIGFLMDWPTKVSPTYLDLFFEEIIQRIKSSRGFSSMGKITDTMR